MVRSIHSRFNMPRFDDDQLGTSSRSTNLFRTQISYRFPLGVMTPFSMRSFPNNAFVKNSSMPRDLAYSHTSAIDSTLTIEQPPVPSSLDRYSSCKLTVRYCQFNFYNQPVHMASYFKYFNRVFDIGVIASEENVPWSSHLEYSVHLMPLCERRYCFYF
jgi:hypothetical protein